MATCCHINMVKTCTVLKSKQIMIRLSEDSNVSKGRKMRVGQTVWMKHNEYVDYVYEEMCNRIT